MIDSIAKAVERRQARVGATRVTAATPFPATLLITGYSDGGLKGGNPGQMRVGYKLEDPRRSGEPLAYAGGIIGHGTNNAAEYMAHILMLRHALRLGFWYIETYTDSELMQRQMEGRYKASRGRLGQLHAEASTLRGLFHSYTITHIPREDNAFADQLTREVVYAEPYLPPLPKVRGEVRVLHEFQAAAVRSWGLRKLASPYAIARIFGVHVGAVNQIIAGRTYRDADFNLPPLLPPEKTEDPTPLQEAVAGIMEWQDAQHEEEQEWKPSDAD